MKFAFENIHKYYRELQLDNHLSDVAVCAEKLTLENNEPLVVIDGFIYFVAEGVVSFSMNDDPRIIGTTIENMPIGLMEIYCPIIKFNYMALTPATILKVSLSDFERIFFGASSENMKELAIILSYMGIFILDVHVERRTDSGYHAIKAMLHRYLYRRTVNITETEGVANFILRRTNLSRSYVYRVLAELREGQYITMNKGKLISIDRKLPEDF